MNFLWCYISPAIPGPFSHCHSTTLQNTTKNVSCEVSDIMHCSFSGAQLSSLVNRSHHLWITLTFLLKIPQISEKRDNEKKLRKNMKWLCAQLEYTQFFKIKTTIGFQCFLDVVPYSCCPIFLSSPTTACFSWTFLVFYRWISNS